MGIWRFTMPLLSTLAALVIIVHSEEELDPGFRRDLRPRAVDPGTTSYEQPWKAVDTELSVQQSTHTDLWDDDSLEEPTARRRPVRKRKRRPQTSSENEPDERHLEVPQSSYSDTDYHDSHQTDLTRRRRKRPDIRPYRWANEPVERPLRRRGLRRKRPTIDSNQRLSEFDTWGRNTTNTKDDHQEHHTMTDHSETYYTEDAHKQKPAIDYYDPDPGNIDYNINEDPSKEEMHKEKGQSKISTSDETTFQKNKPKTYNKLSHPQLEEDSNENRGYLSKPTDARYVAETLDKSSHEVKEDQQSKPLSEFSMEVLDTKSLDKFNANVNGKLSTTDTEEDATIKIQDKTVKLGVIINGVEDNTLSLELRHDIGYPRSEFDVIKADIEKQKCQAKLGGTTIDMYTYLLGRSKLISYYTRKWMEKISSQVSISDEEIRQFESLDEYIQEYDPIDPYTLKQILKRSNGTSLSEILQRHNLSLTDLLRGRGEAILALNKDPSDEPQPEKASSESEHQIKEVNSKYTQRKQATTEQTSIRNSLNKDEDTSETVIQMKDTTTKIDTETQKAESNITENEQVRSMPRIVPNRRFPTGIRRKLRMRPMLNSTLKAQLGRDLIALSARKYFNNNRNISKSREWKDVIPMMTNRSASNDDTGKLEIIEFDPTTTEAAIDTTIPDSENLNSLNSSSSETENSYVKDNEVEVVSTTTTEPATTIILEDQPSSDINTETDKPKVTPIVRPPANTSALRRQAFNNRLKRKRLKQKSSTTENPSDDLTKNFFGMANLVSASEFIERTQKPQTTIIQENTEYATELEDFMTTQAPTTVEDRVKTIRMTTSRYMLPSVSKSTLSTSISDTTEQSAKVEIEEILNDTMTSERLAKILRERNMTLSELVMHRERGSSHVHLADIFHNASKEPNPPEPFLTKSSIEPISKETYPLRAILEANTHDATAKTTSQTAGAHGNYIHIPVVMDFGNNVNENGENMGIIALFKKRNENEDTDKTEIRKDSHGIPYISSIISLNTTITNDTNRESRVLGDNEDIQGWNELLSLIHKHNISTTGEELISVNEDILPLGKSKITLEDDVDGDGLIILEDLQHLKDFDSNIASASDEKLEVRMYEASEAITEKPGILNKLPSNTRSVAIATASILGLATILFLLTYIAFKYKQQRDVLRKKDSFCDERIPSPVFEHRKGNKINCSSRSISPMISTSNIYTMSTLGSHNGKESPDYMWNSFRKPFQ